MPSLEKNMECDDGLRAVETVVNLEGRVMTAIFRMLWSGGCKFYRKAPRIGMNANLR